jgi:hypothetical protein
LGNQFEEIIDENDPKLGFNFLKDVDFLRRNISCCVQNNRDDYFCKINILLFNEFGKLN